MKKLLLVLLGLSIGVYADTLEEIKTKGKIRVGIFDDYPPFAYRDDKGELIGSNIDIAKEIAKGIFGEDGKLEIILTSRDNRAVALVENQVDWVIAGYDKTPAREKIVDFGEPYLKISMVAITKSDAGVKNMSDLEGKKIGVKAESQSHRLAKQKYSTLDCVATEGENNPAQMIDALKAGRIDAIIGEDRDYWALLTKNKDLKIAIPDVAVFQPAAPVVIKGNKALLEAINAEMKKIHEDGRLKAIYTEHFKKFYGDQFNFEGLLPQ